MPAERSTFQKVIAPAVTAQRWLGEAAAVPFHLAGKLDVASGIKTLEQAESRAKTYGDFTRDFAEGAMVPWSKAAGLAGTGIRALQSGGLGAAQGLLEKGDPKDAAVRGGLSAVASPVAEGALALVGKGMRSLPGAAARITRQDTERLGQAIGEISDPLKGATTAKDIQRLAGGVGQRRLSAAKEQIVQTIEKATGNPRFSLASFGDDAQLTLREANAAMTKLGHQAFGGKKNPELIQQYHAMERELFSALDGFDPQLAQLYKHAQQEWMKGTYLLNFLSLQPMYKETSKGVEMAIPYAQKRVSAPKGAKTLTDKLGADDYAKLVATLKRGATEGADVMRSTSPFSLRGLLASGGLGAAGGLAGGPVGVGLAAAPYVLPNALSTYVGQAPYALSTGGKAATAFGGKSVLDLLRGATRGQAD
jgi:hypothetical protein